MKPAQDRLAPISSGLTFNDPAMPVVTNVDARVTTAPDELRDALVGRFQSPVRWLESMTVADRATASIPLSKLDQGKFCQGLCARSVAT